VHDCATKMSSGNVQEGAQSTSTRAPHAEDRWTARASSFSSAWRWAGPIAGTLETQKAPRRTGWATTDERNWIRDPIDEAYGQSTTPSWARRPGGQRRGHRPAASGGPARRTGPHCRLAQLLTAYLRVRPGWQSVQERTDIQASRPPDDSSSRSRPDRAVGLLNDRDCVVVPVSGVHPVQ